MYIFYRKRQWGTRGQPRVLERGARLSPGALIRQKIGLKSLKIGEISEKNLIFFSTGNALSVAN